MPSFSPSRITIKFFPAAASINIIAKAAGAGALHTANDNTANIQRILREVMDKSLRQCIQQTVSPPANGTLAPIDDLMADANGDLTFDPNYTMQLKLSQMKNGNTSVAPVNVIYNAANASFQIQAAPLTAPSAWCTNIDRTDPKLLREAFSKIWSCCTPPPAAVSLTIVNSRILLTV
ncbi:MAG TPA: hypothetical protein VGM05_10615 [Planctomycetaceae bacterium]|jgi:hypothetical protein